MQALPQYLVCGKFAIKRRATFLLYFRTTVSQVVSVLGTRAINNQCNFIIGNILRASRSFQRVTKVRYKDFTIWVSHHESCRIILAEQIELFEVNIPLVLLELGQVITMFL